MRRRSGRLAPAVLTALLLTTAGVGCARAEQRPVEVAAPVELPTPGAVDAPVDEPTATPPAVESMGVAPSRSAAPKPKPKSTGAPTRAGAPRPPTKPLTETGAPPAPRPPAPTGCAPSYRGSAVSRSQVKAALTDAAQRSYWPVSAPEIRIPVSLVKATAWQESGWQSNIIACDKGIGLMQVQPETAEWMNQRFERDYDVYDHQDNAYLGGTYLAWLTKKIGDTHFASDYRLDSALCGEELNSCLLNAVIAAYNFGVGAVIPQEEQGPIVIPNSQYVYNVRALMRDCVCLDY
ncbi:transglycosylase SLT domain-containing protein [Micromonospora sp. CPCC 205556]